MILLDDAQSTATAPSSRLYQNGLKSWSVYSAQDHAKTKDSIDACLAEIDGALARGEFVVAAFAYELGQYFHRLPDRSQAQQTDRHPLIQAWSFANHENLSKQQVDEILKERIESLDTHSQSSGVANVRLSMDEPKFTSDIETIHEYIRNGDTYQINLTFRITGEAYGEPLALYARLRDRQPGRFGAYISDGSHHILSQSPELFIQRQGETLKAMPMKGTANALNATAEQLSSDAKNQAENVMIVDLLRNDLGRLAIPGSVSVPQLFEVARHGDVLQMTSTVTATARPDIHLRDVLEAVFPCGSVTGAPKKRSMEIIQELEPEDRGYYCGALGWLDPNGDFALSVPIRTVEIHQDFQTQASHLTLGVGAGITNDSEAKQEWDECHVKAAFLCDLPSSVGIFETILISESKAQHVQLHLNRLMQSAIALGITFKLSDAISMIEGAIKNCKADEHWRLRLDLSKEGELSYRVAPLNPIANPVEIFWASQILPQAKQAVVHSGNVLLRHKVSHRDAYDLAWQRAEHLGGFDALFTNEQGFVTEGGRTSIFIQSGDKWLTPPITAGVLPGVMRSLILSDPKWNAHEVNLTIEEVINAKGIILSNALRGVIPAYFRKPA